MPFDCLYFDYRNAFDSVPRMRLMRKVESCGIIEQVQRWIKSFQQGRRQRVRVGEAVSGWKKVTSGIPQGSVLGPTQAILFVMFISDQSQVEESPNALFTEHIKVFREIQSARTVRSCIKTMMNCKYGQQSGNFQSMRVNAIKVTHYGKTTKRQITTSVVSKAWK